MSDFDQDPWATNDAPEADPWAAGPPADEAQTSAPAPTSTAPTVAPSKETITVTNTEGKTGITTTIKYGSGFDAPWTVIHSNTVEEATATLGASKALMELTAKVAKYAKSLDSGTAAAARAATGGQSQPASPPPGQPSKSCPHGEMVYRTGNGTKGAWKGHFCPLEKGNPEQCKPIFVK